MTKSSTGRIELSSRHVDAVNRPRRVVQNFDVMLIDPDAYDSVDAIIASRFAFLDDPHRSTDSVWWNWGEGNVVPYPSRHLPLYSVPGYRRWFDQGVNIVAEFERQTHQRGLECFYSQRMNGADNDPNWAEDCGTYVDDSDRTYAIPMKQQNPDWLIEIPHVRNGLWNYAVQGVREYQVRNLREIAEDYNFDGIELDFARSTPVLPPGQGWLLRDAVTDLIRRVRLMTLEVEERRGRAFLLAARVPENLMGCHFDGLDVQTWAAQQLIDLFALGCRNFEVDVAAFGRIAASGGGAPIKLYCALDDHHSSDGYCAPPIEVLRGVIANWYHQGADGVETFNFKFEPDDGELHWSTHQQLYREIGDADTLRPLDKTFVINRRGGGHGASIIPDPEDWTTPRRAFHNTNMLCTLPASLDNQCKADTLLTLYVADDVSAAADHVRELSLHVLLSDPAAAGRPCDARLPIAIVRDYKVPRRDGGPAVENIPNSPPAIGIENQFQVRINNILLDWPRVENGWLVFSVLPQQLAVGENLLGMCLTQRDASATEPMLIEKVQLHVKYDHAG